MKGFPALRYVADHAWACCTCAGRSVAGMAGLILLLALLAACQAAPPVSPTLAVETATAGPPPGAQPSPSAAPARTPTVVRPPSVTPAPGLWRHYQGLNEISSLAFDAAGMLWAGTNAGVVRWDLTTDTPAHDTFDTCTVDLAACGADTHWVHDLAVAGDAVWAATTGGVRRLDLASGGAWTTFTQDDGLPDRGAASVAVGPDGTVWAGTFKGLARFDGSTWTAYAAPGLGAGNVVWDVEVAPEGDVWFSTHGLGVIRLDPGTEAWHTYGTETGFYYPNARALTLDAGGYPWLYVGYDRVYRFDGETWSVAYESGGGQWVCDLAFGAAALTEGGWPLIATCDGYHAYGNGIAYHEGDGWSYIDVSDGLPTHDIQAPAGELAVGTLRGLALYQDGAWRTLRHGPTINNVTSVAATEDGVWFAFGNDAFRAAGGGLAHFDGVGWHYVDGVGDAGEGANVRALSVAPDGTLWAGAGCLLARRDGDVWTTVAGCDDLGGDVRFLAFEPDGTVWFATVFDVHRLKPNGDLTVYEDLLPLALTVDAGGRAWVARNPARGGGLVTIDGGSWVTQTVPVATVTSLASLPNGDVWALGDGRLVRFDGTDWSPPVSRPDRMVSLIAGPAGALWGYGSGGVWRRDGEGWESVVALGVPVQAMAFSPGAAGAGLWLGTPRGGVYVTVMP